MIIIQNNNDIQLYKVIVKKKNKNLLKFKCI